eukprot:893172-Lingulodinium_polyedra.AAC.1
MDCCNGDLRIPTVQHYEGSCGCCSSRQDAVRLVFAAAVEARLLLGGDGNQCSVNRWLTMSKSLARQLPGIFWHNLLGRAMARSWQWDRAAEEVVDPDERQMNKRKAWRARCAVNRVENQHAFCVLNWASMPIDWLIMRLQFLDERGDGLLD